MKSEAQKTADLENYWSQRYMDEATGWDLGEVSPPIKAYVDQLTDKSIKILIPGAGNAYEAEYLHKAGFKNVYIIDISELPLTHFKKRVLDFPSNHVLLGDFFALDNAFDLIIEQTFFCSFPPIDNIREHYAKKMHQLLNPNGKLVGLWFNIPLTGDLTKRPFGGTESDYLALFNPLFEVKTLKEAYNSIPPRANKELFGILQKR